MLHWKPVALTPTEFRLLEHLLRHSDMVLTHSQLLTAAWGFAYSEATELLKPAISRLRQNPARPTPIQTLHGVGYRLAFAPAPPNIPSETQESQVMKVFVVGSTECKMAHCSNAPKASLNMAR